MKKYQKYYMLGFLPLGLTSCYPIKVKQYRNESSIQKVESFSSLADKEHKDRSQFTRVNKNGGNDLYLGVVEFDDQGLIHDQRQAEAVYKRIKDKNQSRKKHMVVVFVHGWQNNAKHGNRDLDYFANHLENWVADNMAKDQSITGVYVGWRGKSSKGAILDTSYLTSFWNRKNASKYVGTGQLPEMLSKIEYLVDSHNRRYKNRARLVSIGHSFGASVLLNAVEPICKERMAKALMQERKVVKGYGDIVFLINPAVEANRITALRLAANEYSYKKKFLGEKKGDKNKQSPNIVILSADRDFPNAALFPVGQWIGSMNMASHNIDLRKEIPNILNRKKDIDLAYNQKKMNSTTVGRYTPFVTHELDLLDSTLGDGDVVSFTGDKWLTEYLKKKNGGVEQSYTFKKSSGLTLKKHEKTPHTIYDPIWQIHVKPKVIKGHNDYWKGNVFAFIGDVLSYKLASEIPSFKAPIEKSKAKSRGFFTE